MVFHRLTVGLEPTLCHERRHQARAARMTDVQWFGHGAEVGLDAGGKRCGDRHGVGRLRGIHAQRPGRRRDGAEDAESCRRVPALVVMMRMERHGEAVFDLEADHVSVDQLPAGQAVFFGEREQYRHERNRLMPPQDIGKIIEVQCVRGDAVDQCRIQRARAFVGPED